ncbi:MAG TPA: nucleotidyltransferase family protein, partial [Anaerolineales bacterium]|nr:nucleotidyltransferase family protein [Anaerolineales bacterium]
GVELHWNLIAGHADDRTISVDWFWEQMENLPGRSRIFRDQQIPQLNPTAHLLYLAAHLMLRHEGRNERLIWFYDVDRLIRSGRVDWEVIEKLAQSFGWGALVRYVIEGATSRFGTPFPPEVVNRLCSEIEWHKFLVARQKMAGHITRFEQTWRSLRHLAWPLRGKMIFALFFPSPDYLRWRYRPKPVWIWPIYYLYRWGEVIKELLENLNPFGKQSR